MLRLHYQDTLATGNEITLSKDKAHHLVQVMRAKVDHHFILFNAAGEFDCQIVSIDKKQVSALVGQQRPCVSESDCRITLLQAITRRERMDYSIQKATELGVTCIQPILTEHCVVKLDAKRSQQRINHWQGIAQHATEQSGRLLIPEIRPVLKLDEALEQTPDNKENLRLIFTLHAAKPLIEIESDTKDIYLALGPVGGFSEREVSLTQNAGFHAIKLGPRIMRAETATTAALTAIQMQWGDLNK